MLQRLAGKRGFGGTRFYGKTGFSVLAENCVWWFWRKTWFCEKTSFCSFGGKTRFCGFDGKTRFCGFGEKTYFRGFGGKRILPPNK